MDLLDDDLEVVEDRTNIFSSLAVKYPTKGSACGLRPPATLKEPARSSAAANSCHYEDDSPPQVNSHDDDAPFTSSQPSGLDREDSQSSPLPDDSADAEEPSSSNLVYQEDGFPSYDDDDDDASPELDGHEEETSPEQLCICAGCQNTAIDSPEWDREYCSSSCVVQHVKNEFENWVKSRIQTVS